MPRSRGTVLLPLENLNTSFEIRSSMQGNAACVCGYSQTLHAAEALGANGQPWNPFSVRRLNALPKSALSAPSSAA